MKKDTIKFLKLERVDATKIGLSARTNQFVEIYQNLPIEQAQDQSERCLDCGNPYCQWKCPVHNYIPVWLKLAMENRIEEAAELSHLTNSLPEICGRVCPQDRLCESACTLNDDFGAVTIGNVEKHITDTAFANGWTFSYPEIANDAKKVAIIGSGPAGLSCADVLTRNGIKAVVFERSEFIGGLLTYGIPAFKLEKSLIKKRHQILVDAGVEFKLNCEVGKDISLAELNAEYSAVFIAIGTYKPVIESSISVDGVSVLQALDYLSSVNQDILNGTSVQMAEQIKDKRVLVLGGGDTSMDCIRTSLRLGAASVIGAYRRSAGDMPGSKKEYINATEEGANFEFNAQPIGVIYNDNLVIGVKFIKTSLVIQDDGHRVIQHVAGSEFIIDADIMITAFGFQPEAQTWLNDYKITRDNYGRIQLANNSTQQVMNNIYSGGDIVRGASLVVYAVADGMKVAQEIADKLSQ